MSDYSYLRQLSRQVSIVGELSEAGGELQAQGEAPTGALDLQKLAGKNEVLISGAVQQAASSRFEFALSARAGLLRQHDGRHQAVHVLLGVGAAGIGTEQLDAKQHTLVGRNAEIGHLLAVMSSTQHGSAQIMVLTGVAGACLS